MRQRAAGACALEHLAAARRGCVPACMSVHVLFSCVIAVDAMQLLGELSKSLSATEYLLGGATHLLLHSSRGSGGGQTPSPVMCLAGRARPRTEPSVGCISSRTVLGRCVQGTGAEEAVDADGSGASDADEDAEAKAARLGRDRALGALGAPQPGPVSNALPMRDGGGALAPADPARGHGSGDAAAAAARPADGQGRRVTRAAGKKKKRNSGGEAAQEPSVGAGTPGGRGADAATGAGGSALSIGPQLVDLPAARVPLPAAAHDAAGPPDRASEPDQARCGALAAVARQRASVAGQDWLFAARGVIGSNPGTDPSPAGSTRVAIAGRSAAAGAPATAPAAELREGAVLCVGPQTVEGYGDAGRGSAPATPEPAGAPARAGGAADPAGSVDDADGDEGAMQPVRGEGFRVLRAE